MRAFDMDDTVIDTLMWTFDMDDFLALCLTRTTPSESYMSSMLMWMCCGHRTLQQFFRFIYTSLIESQLLIVNVNA